MDREGRLLYIFSVCNDQEYNCDDGGCVDLGDHYDDDNYTTTTNDNNNINNNNWCQWY